MDSLRAGDEVRPAVDAAPPTPLGGDVVALLLGLADQIEGERIGEWYDDWNIALFKAAEIVRMAAEAP